MDHSSLRSRLRLCPNIAIWLCLLSIPARAQFFPSQDQDADTISSFWSLNVEGFAGISGATAQNSGSTGVGAIPGISSGGGVGLVGTVFSYEGDVGAYYEFIDRLAVGLNAGYARRGTTAIEMVIDQSPYNKLIVDYATIGTRVAFNRGSITFGLGLDYGLPISATVGQDWSDAQYPDDLTSSDQFNIPSSIEVELLGMFRILSVNHQTLSMGLNVDFAFNNLIEPTEQDDDEEPFKLSTTAMELGLSYGFGL